MYIIFSRKDDRNSNYLKGINFRGYKFSRISRFFGKSGKCFVRFSVTRENFHPVGFKKYDCSPWGGGGGGGEGEPKANIY